MAGLTNRLNQHRPGLKASLKKVSPVVPLLAVLLALNIAFPAQAFAPPAQTGQQPAAQSFGQTVTRPTLQTGQTIRLEPLAQGLTSPVTLVEAPDGSGRLFVVDRIGLIRVITPDGRLLEQPFLDIRNRLVDLRSGFDERGLLGLAFHPNYRSNGRFFVYYSAPLRPDAPEDFNHTARLSEFQVSSQDHGRADPASEIILMRIDQPQFNHDGGTLAFHPVDGYLYLSLGDGGGANDTGVGHVQDWYAANDGGNGQDITQNLLGSILRIDVDRGDPFAIPPDNPFVGQPGLDPIYAYGFRNPYRFSIDLGGNHDIIVGDAGQDMFEEVDVVQRGANYGWNVREGSHCFDASEPENPPAQCPTVDPRGNRLVEPVLDYLNANQPNGIGLVVVGGHIYRGSAVPDLQGLYVFGDWSTSFDQPDGNLFVARPSPTGRWEMRDLQVANTPNGRLGRFLLGFGQDLDGEVYVLTSDTSGPTGDTGRVFRIAPAQPGAATGMPGQAQPAQPQQPQAGQAQPGQTQVLMQNISFQPNQISVTPGATVEWVNRDSVPHTVTSGRPGSPTGQFDSGIIPPGGRYTLTFQQPGTYEYFCRIHPSMQATVVVQR